MYGLQPESPVINFQSRCSCRDSRAHSSVIPFHAILAATASALCEFYATAFTFLSQGILGNWHGRACLTVGNCKYANQFPLHYAPIQSILDPLPCYIAPYFAVMHEHAVITLVFLHSDNYIYPFFSKHVHVKEKKHKVWRFTGTKAKVASV